MSENSKGKLQEKLGKLQKTVKYVNYSRGPDHEKEHILEEILYFNDINEDRLKVLKSVFNHSINWLV